MDNTNTPVEDATPGKKEMRKQLADKIAAAIPELMLTLGEEKFHHRIKKAVKLITENLHKKETAKIAKKIKAVAKKAASSPKKSAKKAAKKSAKKGSS